MRATVRDLSNEVKCKHLTDSFPGVKLFQADLLTDGSFDEFCAGAHYILHTASPFQLEVEDPQRDLVDPAKKGTLNVLRSAKKAGTVRRVVVTSSCAAVAPNAPPTDPEYTYTEVRAARCCLPPQACTHSRCARRQADWNNDASLTEAPYRFSKAEAERAAWKFAEEEAGDMSIVTMCPSFVMGPPLSARTDSTSVKFVMKCLDGTFERDGGTGSACFGTVDVRDVARAHVAAIEKDEASGRYILSSSAGNSHLELATMLKEDESFAGYPIPTTQKAAPARRPKYDHSKAERELGIAFTPIKTAVTDMGRALIELGIVTKASA